MTTTTPITADGWVDRATVDPAVAARWPDYRVILLATDDVDVDRLAAVTDRLVADAHTAARRLDPAAPDQHIARWHQAYRDFGVKPRAARVSVDALIRRAATPAGLPRINTLVDLYNAVSILHRVPIGGEDLDRYHGPARLVLANGDEPFPTTANAEPVVDHPDTAEPIWCDDDGVTCRRWNWRQTTRTAINGNTTRVGFIIDSLDAPHHDGARRAAEQLAELIAPSHTRTIGNTAGHR
jgi:DNA/RNA-binding domain of Phe-tRNA-synthetase-like protein